MSLVVGTRLGTYEILCALGAGGAVGFDLATLISLPGGTLLM